MTQEQYNRALELNGQIEELENAKRYIRDMEFRYNSNFTNCAKCIISKYRIMVNSEIDAEIEKLKKKIEEL